MNLAIRVGCRFLVPPDRLESIYEGGGATPLPARLSDGLKRLQRDNLIRMYKTFTVCRLPKRANNGST